MTQRQYVRIAENELRKINEEIDLKIFRGEGYSREAHNHKLLLKKIRQNKNRSFLGKLFFFIPQF